MIYEVILVGRIFLLVWNFTGKSSASGIYPFVAKEMRGCVVLFSHPGCSKAGASFGFSGDGEDHFQGRWHSNIFPSK